MKTPNMHRKSSIYTALLFAGMALFASSCMTLSGSAPAERAIEADLLDAADPSDSAKEREAAREPEWTRKTPKSAEYLYVAGYGKVTDRTTSTKRAVADGKDQLSRWIETKVQAILLEHAASSQSALNQTALEVSRSVSRASLSGVVQKELWADADGGVWVLLEMPRSAPVRQFAEEAKTLTRKDAAAYSEQKMREALKKLEEELE